MRTDGTAFIMLTAAMGICATLAGCASGTGPPAQAASGLTSAPRGVSQPTGNVTGLPRASAPGPGSSGRTPTAQASHPAVASGSASQPAAASSHATALTSGLYTDGPDGTPHYVLSFTSRGDGDLRGSASFLYQDGRVTAVGSYAGTLSGSGKITLTLGDGKILSGSYTSGRLNLPDCAAALPLARATGDCTFAYHGHVP